MWKEVDKILFQIYKELIFGKLSGLKDPPIQVFW